MAPAHDLQFEWMVGFGSDSTFLGLLVCTYHDLFFILSSRRLPLQSKRTIIAFDGRPFGNAS